MKKKNVIRIGIGTGLLMLIPLAFRLTIGTGIDGQGFNWTPFDFVFMGVLLFGLGMIYEFVVSKGNSTMRRVSTGILPNLTNSLK